MFYIIILLFALAIIHLAGFALCYALHRKKDEDWLWGSIVCMVVLALFLLAFGFCRIGTWSELRDLTIEYEYLSLKVEQIAENPNYFSQDTFFHEVDSFNRALLDYNDRAGRWFNWKMYSDASNLSLILVDYS